jgi:hypothetical protein
MTTSIITVVVAVMDGVGAVFFIKSQMIPLPKEKESRENFILRCSFYRCIFEIQNSNAFCSLWIKRLLFKNVSAIGQTGRNTSVLFIISDGTNLEKQQMIIREKTQKLLDDYAKRGLRTLCIAKKVRLPSVPHLLCLSPCLAIISENQLI